VRSDENLKENAEKIAKRIIVEVIQRVTSDTSVERRAIMIEVPKDHIKGKIVGKDGMNIKAFEAAINVDVVFNDMPNVISISAFNMVDRRIANVAMEKLVRIKGEITPEIVTRTVKLAERETDEELFKIGREALRKNGDRT
jgi:ribonuclease Y